MAAVSGAAAVAATAPTAPARRRLAAGRPVIVSVVGARPNFMKLAPVAHALKARDWADHVIIHTGQHYDAGLSDTFFEELDIPRPDHNLSVGSSTHATQTAAVMQRFEPVCRLLEPQAVLVYGDVNSTVAAALVAAKLGIRVVHVEAGLRSRDRGMPEELNRIVTDHLSDLLLAPSPDAVDNLRAEGIPPGRIHFVGNVMIDSLSRALPRARERNAPERFGLTPGEYFVATLHRPSNVDDPETLRELCEGLCRLGCDRPVVFPAHPRTRDRLWALGLDRNGGQGLIVTEPLGYLDMLSLVASAALVVTDSGGIQEETTWLGVPCLTVRTTTERPITCEQGTNRLVAPRCDALLAGVRAQLGRTRGAPPAIDRWDGRAAERIADLLVRECPVAAGPGNAVLEG